MPDKSNPPIPVMITAVGGGGHGEQILKALLLAERGRYRIHGADANPNCPQFQQVERSFVLPHADDPAYLDDLFDLCSELGVQAVFHGCEPELKLFSRERDRFKEAGLLLPINPAEVIETCMDKLATARWLDEQGFEPPRFHKLDRVADIERVNFFPAVVKPSIGGGGSANCYVAQNQAELKALALFLNLDECEQTFMVQEYVGTSDAEYTAGVLHDLDGNFLNSIAVKREFAGQLNIRFSVPNRTGRRELGDHLVISSGVSQGYVDRFPEVTERCEELAQALGVRGAINIQCRLVDGQVKVFEINPRFSGTTSVRALMEYNEPDILLRKHLLGQVIPQRFPYRTGRVNRSLVETVLN